MSPASDETVAPNICTVCLSNYNEIQTIFSDVADMCYILDIIGQLQMDLQHTHFIPLRHNLLQTLSLFDPAPHCAAEKVIIKEIIDLLYCIDQNFSGINRRLYTTSNSFDALTVAHENFINDGKHRNDPGAPANLDVMCYRELSEQCALVRQDLKNIADSQSIYNYRGLWGAGAAIHVTGLVCYVCIEVALTNA